MPAAAAVPTVAAVPIEAAVPAVPTAAAANPRASLLESLRAAEDQAMRRRDYASASKIKDLVDEVATAIQQQDAAIAQRQYAEAGRLESTIHAAAERAHPFVA